jgi:MOSC domain-containing protein YiiM
VTADRIVSIHVAAAAGAPMVSVGEARAVPARGLEGDRYFVRAGAARKPGGHRSDVTLIEVEAIEALARDYGVTLDPGAARRNLVTRGVALNHLVGREFRVGEALLRGEGLAEPCGRLARLTGEPVRPGLLHRGGLRAAVLRGGTIRVGDPVEPLGADGGHHE